MGVNLGDPCVLIRDDVLADPRELYDALRRDAPIWQLPGQDTFLVSDPDLIREAVARPAELSSNLVSLLHRDAGGCPVAFDLLPFGDPTHVLATADPPAHTGQRKLVQPHLSPAAVAPLEPTLRALVARELSPLVAAGRGDIVASVGDPIPAMAICHLLGVPVEDATSLVPAVLETGALIDGVADLDGMARAGSAALELTAYAQRILDAARRLAPDERLGLLAVLADGVDAGVVDADQAANILVQLFSAGTETTSSLIATAVETLARRPDLQDELRREPDRIPGALEEVLRDDGPFQFHYRWATTDTVLGRTTIPARSRVLLVWAAANRPAPGLGGERRAEDAGPGPHLAFGRGRHFCIGAPLARLEARVVLEELLGRTVRISLDPDLPPTRRPSILLRRHATLPVVVEGAR